MRQNLKFSDYEDSLSRKRARTTFNSEQVVMMEEIFVKTHYPDVEMRERLCRETGLPESRIQVNNKNFDNSRLHSFSDLPNFKIMAGRWVSKCRPCK